MMEERNTPYCDKIRNTYQEKIADLGGYKEILNRYDNMGIAWKAMKKSFSIHFLVAICATIGAMVLLLVLIACDAPFIVSFGIPFALVAVCAVFMNKNKDNMTTQFVDEYRSDDLKISTEGLEKDLKVHASKMAEAAVTRYLDMVQAYSEVYVTSSNVAKLAGEVYYSLKWSAGQTKEDKSFQVWTTHITCGKILEFNKMKWNNLPSFEAAVGLARAMGQLILVQLRLDHPEYNCEMEITDNDVQYYLTKKPKEQKLEYTQLTDLV